jgi:hypothetical protein
MIGFDRESSDGGEREDTTSHNNRRCPESSLPALHHLPKDFQSNFW